jgi:tight adherence protein C
MFELIATSPSARIAVLLAIFVAVVAAMLTALSHLQHRRALRAQLDRATGSASGSIQSITSLRSDANDGAWARLAKAVEAAGLNLSDRKIVRLSARLRAAGYTSAVVPQIFTLSRLVLMVVLPLGYVVLAFAGAEGPSFLKAAIIVTVLALIGLFLPSLFVRAETDRRRRDITNGFPDCLDLLIVCVESGLGIEAAIDRVGREMVRSHPLIAELLSITTLQLRAGASREDAFRKLSDSAEVDEIRSFTTLLIQSDKLGTSITATLRVYAAEMREIRRMRAEERAHRLPVLISIPLVACLLPVMIGVLMLPAVVRMIRIVIPMMVGD